MAKSGLPIAAMVAAVLTLAPFSHAGGQIVTRPGPSGRPGQVIPKPATPAGPQTRPLQTEVRPQAGTIALAKPIRVPKPGARNAEAMTAQLAASNVALRQRPRMTLVAIAQTPGVHQLNRQNRGVLEPGGDYEIGGAGFGTATGSVFVRHGGRTLPMRITHWSDSQIFASLRGDISGLPDAGSVELAVGPAGKPAFTTAKFGFRAARADVPLAINDAMFSYDRGRIIQVAGISVPTNRAPDRKSFDGNKIAVNRYVSDDGSSKRCFEPGFDRIRTDIPLKPGFEITNVELSPSPSVNRGRYGTSWEARAVRIEYGVHRDYTPQFGLIGGHGSCTSRYEARLIATGPRGMQPQ